VTEIGESAFKDCKALANIVIGNSVTVVGDCAFEGCPGLTSVTIPDSVTKIGSSAFEGCTGLTDVVISNCVQEIGFNAFNSCSGLASIVIPDSVTKIEDSAFYGCSGLKSIIVSDDNKNYDSRNNCNAIIETATDKLIKGCDNSIIPDSVREIGDQAFRKCAALRDIAIPGSVTAIGRNAFSSCAGLTSIVIPELVTKIQESAFQDCSGLTNVVIPDSVEVIENYAFRGCSSLTSVIIPNPAVIIAESAFDDGTELIVKNEGRLTLKRYVMGLQYDFEEFDKEENEGSYYTTDGALGELFDNDQIDKALGEHQKKNLDEVSEEEIDDIIRDLVLNLDQGAIKFLKISDGNKTLYEDSNDKPYDD